MRLINNDPIIQLRNYFKSLHYLVNLIFVWNVLKNNFKKKLKCNFCFEASEYSLMLKLTNLVIWNNFNSFHYAGTKNLLGAIT